MSNYNNYNKYQKQETSLQILEKQMPALKSQVDQIFYNNPVEVKKFLNYVVAVKANNEKIAGLNENEVNACILQMYFRGADPTNGEAYIVPRSGKARLTIGYKFAEKKLWETGELAEKPYTTEIYEGELKQYYHTNHNATIEPIKITSYKEQQELEQKPVIGYLTTIKMNDGLIIEKFFGKEQIEAHCQKYSEGYKASIKPGANQQNVGITNKSEMFKKTAFMRTYTMFLPKTQKITKAIQDINALNEASYTKMERLEKPKYYDNPLSKENIKPATISKAPKDLQIANKEQIVPVLQKLNVVKPKEKKIEIMTKIKNKVKTAIKEQYGYEGNRGYVDTPMIMLKKAEQLIDKVVADYAEKKTGKKLQEKVQLEDSKENENK